MMLRKLFNFTTVVWILVTGIFLNLAYIAYLAWYPFPTAVYNNDPFPIVNPQPIKAGEVLVFVADYCRLTKVPSDLNRTLVGPTIITIAQDTSISDPGCKKVNVSNTVIPSYAPTGKYYLKISVCYRLNPLRNDCQELRTQDFEVVK